MDLMLFASFSFLLILDSIYISAKPGRVVGPLPPYENGNLLNEAYDPRSLIKSTAVPSRVIPPAYCYRRYGTVKQERSAETERSVSTQTNQVARCSMANKGGSEIAINIDTNPFYMTRAGVNKMDHVDNKTTIDANLLQPKSQYGRISKDSSAHRDVGAVQVGMTRTY